MNLSPRVRAPVRGAALGGAAWFLAAQLGAREALGSGDMIPVLGALLVGAALAAAGRERLVLGAVMSGVLVLLLAGFTPIVTTLGRAFQRNDGPQAVDAVVVLGAGVNPEGLMSPSAVDRLLEGLERAGPGDSVPLAVSAVRRRPLDAVSTASDIARLAHLAGRREVIYVRDVFSTRDEALAVRAIAARRGWKRVGVVTSPSHTSRACRTFETVGLTIACWPSRERGARTATATTVTERLMACPLVFYEVLGWAVYKVRGWV